MKIGLEKDLGIGRPSDRSWFSDLVSAAFLSRHYEGRNVFSLFNENFKGRARRNEES